MDKNTIIGLVLMVAVFVGFSFYQSNEMEKQNDGEELLGAFFDANHRVYVPYGDIPANIVNALEFTFIKYL